MTLTVRPLCTDDYPQWRPLWDGYTHFYECYLDESVTAATGTGRSQIHHFCFAVSWRRTAASSASPCASCMKGPRSTAPVCYLEDLFVDAAERGAGAGKALIDALIDEGKREGWSKLYWVTRMNNPARKLYDHYGEADDYVRYRISL